VQAAIVTKPPAHLGLETTHFFRDRLVLVRSAKSGSDRKKQAPKQHRLRELGRMKLILPSPKHNLRQVIENAVRLGAAGPGKILEIDGLLTTFEVVRNSDWATVVSSIAVLDEVEKGKLVAEPIFEPELWLDFNLVRTKDMFLPVACRHFLDLLKDKLEQLGRRRKFLANHE